MDAWAAGDKAAAGELFHKHFRRVYRFLRSKTERDVDDLVQDTFLACIESRDRFRRDAAFTTFLYAVARNVLGKALRKRAKGTESPDFGVTSLFDLGETPSQLLVRHGEQRLLLEGLRRLPVDDQILVELHYVERLSGPDLARIFDTTLPAMRSRLRRARERLGAAMKELSESPDLLESTITRFEDWAVEIRDLFDPPDSARAPSGR